MGPRKRRASDDVSKDGYPRWFEEGTLIRKHFPGHGAFDGTITKLRKPFYFVRYSDGDEEELDRNEVIDGIKMFREFHRQLQDSAHTTPAALREKTFKNAMKIDYGALGSVGILIAIFRDPTHPKSAVFLGSYLIDIEANRDSMADKTRTTKAAFIVDSKDPTQYKQVSSDNGTGSMREGILLHVSEDPKSVANPQRRCIFASNHAKVLNAYSKATFRYPIAYEVGEDLTEQSTFSSGVLADFLTWDDTMTVMRENIFVDETTETLLGCDEIMEEYFGCKWEKARRYFHEAAHFAAGDVELERFDLAE